jgi:hypothetical protein
MKEDKFLDFIMRKKWGCFEKNFWGLILNAVVKKIFED